MAALPLAVATVARLPVIQVFGGDLTLGRANWPQEALICRETAAGARTHTHTPTVYFNIYSSLWQTHDDTYRHISPQLPVSCSLTYTQITTVNFHRLWASSLTVMRYTSPMSQLGWVFCYKNPQKNITLGWEHISTSIHLCLWTIKTYCWAYNTGGGTRNMADFFCVWVPLTPQAAKFH